MFTLWRRFRNKAKTPPKKVSTPPAGSKLAKKVAKHCIAVRNYCSLGVIHSKKAIPGK